MIQLKEHIAHRRKVRRGLTTMLLVILVALFFRYLYLKNYEPDHTYYSDRLSEVTFVEVPPTYTPRKKTYSSTGWDKAKQSWPVKKVERFAFDPNTISHDSLQLLGLPKYLATNIGKYKAKGGTFEEPEDFAKVYGMEQYYDDLKQLIRIDTAAVQARKAYRQYQKQKKREETAAARAAEEDAQRVVVELNTADSIALIGLKGVGPFYAKTILELRDKLGGFVSIDQLSEAYAVHDTIVQVIGAEWLTVDPTKVQKININTADFKTLIRHPYIDKKQTNAILMYRKAHGSYKAVEELKKIHLISEEDYQLLSPYVRID